MITLAKAARNITVGGFAVFYTALTFGVATTPAPANAFDGHYYRADFAEPVDSGIKVVRGTAWACEGTTCVADKGTSRPLIICQRLAQKTGAVTNFTVNGEALPAEQLAQCQAKG
ncbi:CC_3452 family protein [Qipengyuania sp. CAU 1752]